MSCNGFHRWAVCSKGADEEGFGPEPLQCTNCARYQFNYGTEYMDYLFNPIEGEFVSEMLETDTIVYQVVASTAKSLTLQRTLSGRLMENAPNNVSYHQAVPWLNLPVDIAGEVQIRLRRRQDGTFRRRKRAHAIGPAFYIRDVPVTRTDYSF